MQMQTWWFLRETHSTPKKSKSPFRVAVRKLPFDSLQKMRTRTPVETPFPGLCRTGSPGSDSFRFNPNPTPNPPIFNPQPNPTPTPDPQPPTQPPTPPKRPPNPPARLSPASQPRNTGGCEGETPPCQLKRWKNGNRWKTQWSHAPSKRGCRAIWLSRPFRGL